MSAPLCPHPHGLALKGNRGTGRTGVDLFVAGRKAVGSKDTTAGRDETRDGGHGRSEARTTTVIHEVAWLGQPHARPGLNAVAIIDSRRGIGRATERGTRPCLASPTLPAYSLDPIVRSHRPIGNSLHGVMDRVLRHDACRVRTHDARASFTTLEHGTLTLTRTAPGKDALRLRRKVAAWDDHFLHAGVTQ